MPTLRKPLVLVVEDDESTRSGLIQAFEADGYEAVGAANAAAALQEIRGTSSRPDVVILDLRMPILNGWEFLTIREGDPALLLIPVIVMSGEKDAISGDESVVFLSKPVNLKSLRELVSRILTDANPEPGRVPSRTEPWAVDRARPNVVRNRLGHVVVFASSERAARRLVAAVNGTSRISTDALEQGIIDKGLGCLYDLKRYDTDADYREQIGGDTGLASIRTRRDEIAARLREMAFGTELEAH